LDQFSRVLNGDANDGSNSSVTFNYTWLMNHQLNSAGVNNSLFQFVPQAGTVSYGAANADNGLTTAGGASMTYDGNLNLANDGVNTLTYDVENRMVQAESASWGTSNYLYDPLGERKQKVVGVNTDMPVATDFVLAGGAEIADYYETSATWRLTVRGGGWRRSRRDLHTMLGAPGPSLLGTGDGCTTLPKPPGWSILALYERTAHPLSANGGVSFPHVQHLPAWAIPVHGRGDGAI
jgi:hypothetical protein